MKTNEQKNQDKEKKLDIYRNRLSNRRVTKANFVWWGWKMVS